MNYKCVIVDDEQHAIDILQAHIAKVPEMEVKLATTNPIEAFSYVQSHGVDLVFLDIQMPELSGLQFLSLLQEKTKVILTTAYREHAIDGFEHNVADYLLKPVIFPRFLKAVSRIIKTDQGPEKVVERAHFFVKTGVRSKLVKIEFDKIVLVESMGNYVHFNMIDEKITSLMPLKEVAIELPITHFLRINQSFIVAKKYILGREGNQILLPGKSLPIGETYKKTVQEYFHDNK